MAVIESTFIGIAPQALSSTAITKICAGLVLKGRQELCEGLACTYAPFAAARQHGSESRLYLIDDTDLAGAIAYLPKG